MPQGLQNTFRKKLMGWCIEFSVLTGLCSPCSVGKGHIHNFWKISLGSKTVLEELLESEIVSKAPLSFSLKLKYTLQRDSNICNKTQKGLRSCTYIREISNESPQQWVLWGKKEGGSEEGWTNHKKILLTYFEVQIILSGIGCLCFRI